MKARSATTMLGLAVLVATVATGCTAQVGEEATGGAAPAGSVTEVSKTASAPLLPPGPTCSNGAVINPSQQTDPNIARFETDLLALGCLSSARTLFEGTGMEELLATCTINSKTVIDYCPSTNTQGVKMGLGQLVNCYANVASVSPTFYSNYDICLKENLNEYFVAFDPTGCRCQ